MRLVMLESPWAGEIERNRAYLYRALKDSLYKGESPYASHRVWADHAGGLLDDTNKVERALGIAAGTAWLEHCEAMVVYCDYGITEGMVERIEKVRGDPLLNIMIEYRKIGKNDE